MADLRKNLSKSCYCQINFSLVKGINKRGFCLETGFFFISGGDHAQPNSLLRKSFYLANEYK